MSQASPIATDRSRMTLPTRPGLLYFLGRILLGLILVFGGYTKLHFNGAWHFRDYYFFFAMAIGSNRILPFGAVQWLARVLPWTELTLGALLIAGVGMRWVSMITSALLMFMMSLPRSESFGVAGYMNPVTELILGTGFFLVALAITLNEFHSHRAGQRQS